MKKASLGDRIKALRASESRPLFSGRFEVSIDTISRYENGQTFPDADFIRKLCNHYNVSADWLIFGDEKFSEKAPGKTPPAQLAPVQEEKKINHDYSKIADEWALDLPLEQFEDLWDIYRAEKEARRGWLQVEVIKRFPEFLEWLGQHQTPLSPAQIASIKKTGHTHHYGPPNQLEED